MTPKMTKAQQRVWDALDGRFLCYWGQHYAISREPGPRDYDREREMALTKPSVPVTTIDAMVRRGLLIRVTWFQVDATGKRATVYKRSDA